MKRIDDMEVWNFFKSHQALWICVAILFHGCMTSSCQKTTDWIIDQTGVDKDPRPFKGIHSDFIVHANSFTELTGYTVGDVAIGFDNLNPGVSLPPEECYSIPGPWDSATKEYCKSPESYSAAICFMRRSLIKGWYKWVAVDILWYERNRDNFSAIEQMIYHELGHCVLSRDHNDESFLDTDGIRRPVSVMRSTLFSGRELLYYELNKETIYVKELIGETKN